MKKIPLILLAVVMILSLAACAGSNESTGNNSNTDSEGVAQKLADGLGADLYEIVSEQPYTNEDLDYGNSKSRPSVEISFI